MALAGADGAQAARLLRASVKHGAAVLGTLAEAAVKRLLADPEAAEDASRLFTDEEREQLADALAATNATADLLGRARIARRLEDAAKHSSFAEATDFTCFDESPIRPLAPRKALDWFRRLIPGLNPDPGEFTKTHERQGFNLAVTTDETLLGKVKAALARILETGEGAARGPKVVRQILDDAGVSSAKPGYAENVYRTSMMGAYNRGAEEEMREAGDDFPAWRYKGIADGRQRPAHAKHFDKYFPASASFAEVRDSVAGHFDGYQCRCSFLPVHKSEWKRLRAGGAAFSSFAEAFGESADARLYAELTRFCQSGPNEGKPGPCPEHQDRKRGLLARAGKAGRAVRVAKVAEHHVVEAIKSKVPPKLQTAAKIAVKTVFSTWVPAQAAAYAVAKEVGGERHAKKVSNALIAADLIAAKIVPAGVGAVAGPAAASVAYMTPLASTAYLAYSTARHPAATFRAARNAIASAGGMARGAAKKIGLSKSAEEPASKWPREDVAALLRGFDAAGEDGADWYEALIAVALQATGGDVDAAVHLANEALAARPAEPQQHAEPTLARFADSRDLPDGLLEVPDIRQPNSYGCGAAAAMACARYFGAGPTDFEAWQKLLGTDPDAGTPPEAIVRVLSGLGLVAQPRQLMSLADLRDCWRRGCPVICPIQDYGPDAGPSDYDDGHYVVAVGGPMLGYVFVQDSMADVELEGANSVAAGGKVMVPQARFRDVWHDRGAGGRYYLRFGIVVGGERAE